MDRIAALAATEAFAHATGWGNGKGWSFVVVERTQSFVTCTCAAKCDIIGNDVNNVGGIYNSVDGGLWYHCLIGN